MKIENGTNNLDLSRKNGAEFAVKFLDKIKAKFDWTNSYNVFAYLKYVSEKDLFDTLSRMNGLIKELPLPDRNFILENSGESVHNPMTKEVFLVFPPVETRERLAHYFYEKIHNFLNTQHVNEDGERRIALAMFNFITYVHPFKDGNGRTARLSYFLTSPDVKSIQQESLLRNIQTRPPYMRSYHDNLNLYARFFMLDNRKLEVANNQAKDMPDLHEYKLHYTHAGGFDQENLAFISAYDVMSEEERKRFNKSRASPSMVFDWEDLPVDIQIKTAQHLNDVREEFIKNVIDLSLDPPPAANDMIRYLNNSLGIDTNKAL